MVWYRGLALGLWFTMKPCTYGLNGWVKNDNDGVHIEVNASWEIAHIFYQSIINNPPERARITVSNIIQVPVRDYRQFEIIHDTMSEHAKVHLTPDFATCDNCRSELFTPKNRRDHYPFITCSECGPRYSIVHRLPYDRENTSMDVFSMCEVHATVNIGTRLTGGITRRLIRVQPVVLGLLYIIPKKRN
jgi:hydrogenase maturation protein HypF